MGGTNGLRSVWKGDTTFAPPKKDRIKLRIVLLGVREEEREESKESLFQEKKK